MRKTVNMARVSKGKKRGDDAMGCMVVVPRAGDLWSGAVALFFRRERARAYNSRWKGSVEGGFYFVTPPDHSFNARLRGCLWVLSLS